MTDSESTRTPSQSKSTALQGKTVVKIASSFVDLSGDAAGAFTAAQDNKDRAGHGAGQNRNGFLPARPELPGHKHMLPRH